MTLQETTTETAVSIAETMYPSLDSPTNTPARAPRAGFSPEDEAVLEPRKAAVELLNEFRRLAAALSPRDRSTQDDLLQEMCLAALECSQPNQRSYYLWLAGWRAKDYLRWWLTPIKRDRKDGSTSRKLDEESIACSA